MQKLGARQVFLSRAPRFLRNSCCTPHTSAHSELYFPFLKLPNDELLELPEPRLPSLLLGDEHEMQNQSACLAGCATPCAQDNEWSPEESGRMRFSVDHCMFRKFCLVPFMPEGRHKVSACRYPLVHASGRGTIQPSV